MKLKSPCIERRNSWNPEFDFWKFVAAVFIILVHAKFVFGNHVFFFCRQGYLAVEFFFVLSGWFFARSVFRDSRPFSLDDIGDQTVVFLAKRVRSFAIPYCIGYTLCLAIAVLSDGLSGWISKGLVFDFLLMGEAGLSTISVMAANWYLSVLILTFSLIYPFFRLNKRFFASWIAPILAVAAMGSLVREFTNPPANYGVRFGLFSANFVRGFGEICTGIVAYRISCSLVKVEWTAKTRFFLSLLGSILPVLAFVWLASARAAHTTVLLLFAVYAAIGGAGLSFASHFPQKTCRTLGSLSLWLYLTHWSIAHGLKLVGARFPFCERLFSARDTRSTAITLAVYLSLCFLLAIAAMLGWDAICRKRSKTPA